MYTYVGLKLKLFTTAIAGGFCKTPLRFSSVCFAGYVKNGGFCKRFSAKPPFVGRRTRGSGRHCTAPRPPRRRRGAQGIFCPFRPFRRAARFQADARGNTVELHRPDVQIRIIFVRNAKRRQKCRLLLIFVNNYSLKMLLTSIPKIAAVRLYD